MTETTEPYEWHGRTIVGSDGEKIGSIKEIYEDQSTGQPEWATVGAGLFGTKLHFVPLAGAAPDGEDVRAQVTKSQVKDAPGVESDGQLSEHEERTLFEHYGVPYTEEGSTTAQGAPGGRSEGGDDTSARGADEGMTRSAEELSVGTAEREPRRYRLRKYLVTEQVETTVPVQREEIRLEREPSSEGNVEQGIEGREVAEGEPKVVLVESEGEHRRPDEPAR